MTEQETQDYFVSNASIECPGPLDSPEGRAASLPFTKAYQQLSSDAKLRIMAAVNAKGLELLRASPRRAEIERRWLEEEEVLRRFIREMIAKYGEPPEPVCA